jgi:TRAP-type mannitol/chloroaromatic compound transport system permease large subunit
VAPEGTLLADIYKGIIPFVILQLIGLISVILWPQLVIWLPAVAYR